MYGVTIAFKDFTPARGIMGSSWAGLKYFRQYFNSYQFWITIKNTLVISIYSIIVTFPLPIALALMCNQMTRKGFKKFFQVSTYLPHFISTVVMCGMIILFLSPSQGIIAKLLGYLGITLPNLMGQPSAFSSIYVWTEAWQHVGWDSILYIAALSAVDPSLYEAATMDGASKWQEITKITLPSLVPTIITLLLLSIGRIFYSDFGLFYQVPMDSGPLLDITSTIDTYVYRALITLNDYGRSSEAGVYQSVVGFILVLCANLAVKKIGGEENALF